MKKKFSTLVDEDVIKRIKVYSILLDKHISELVQDALVYYLEKLDKEASRK